MVRDGMMRRRCWRERGSRCQLQGPLTCRKGGCMENWNAALFLKYAAAACSTAVHNRNSDKRQYWMNRRQDQHAASCGCCSGIEHGKWRGGRGWVGCGGSGAIISDDGACSSCRWMAWDPRPAYKVVNSAGNFRMRVDRGRRGAFDGSCSACCLGSGKNSGS